MISTLDHIIVAVHDLEAATLSWERLLGYRASWRGGHEAYGTVNSLFRLGNTYLELLAPVGEDSVLLHRGEWTPGLTGLAFGTENIESAVRDLRERGIVIADPQEGEGRDEATGAVRRWRNAMIDSESANGIFMFLIQHDTPDGLPDAPDALMGAAGSPVHALDHVVVQTGFSERAREFFGPEGLGLRLALARDEPKWGGMMLFFLVGGTTVEVIGKRDDNKVHDTLWGLAWQVRDCAAAQARLSTAGFDMSPVRAGRKSGTQVCTVRDAPEGIPTLIISPDKG
ncbi:MAG: VOC family protein [Parvularculales bacterium]